MKELSSEIKESIFIEYVECKLPLEKIAEKYGLKPKDIEFIAFQYANDPKNNKEIDGKKNAIYYKYMAAKLKRRKMLEEEAQKKQQEEAKKLGKTVNKKEKEEQDNAVALMQDFLDAKNSNGEALDKATFCEKSMVSYRYFEHQLAIVYDCNRELYNQVKRKYYTDYIASLKQKEENISEEQYELKVSEAKSIMYSYILPTNSKYLKKEFCSKYNMSEKYFDSMLYMLKDEDTETYESVSEKIHNDILLKSSIFRRMISAISKSIDENKVKESNGIIRDFCIYDYYNYTKINLDVLIEYADKFKMKSEFDVLEKFKQENLDDSKSITLSQALKKYKDSPQKVNEVFEYLEKNEYPLLVGTVEMAMKREISKDEKKDRPMDEFLLDDLKAISGEDEAKKTIESLRKVKLQKEKAEQEDNI